MAVPKQSEFKTQYSTRKDRETQLKVSAEVKKKIQNAEYDKKTNNNKTNNSGDIIFIKEKCCCGFNLLSSF